MVKFSSWIVVALLAFSFRLFDATSASAIWEDEPTNNTAAGAAGIALGEAAVGMIGDGDYQDYWYITISSTKINDVLAINSGTGSTGSASFDVTVRDMNTSQIVATINNLTPTSYAHSYPTLLAGHAYYILIESNLLEATSYNVTIT